MTSINTTLLVACALVPLGLIAVRYWSVALLGVFILLVFEGALRKWVFPWAQAQIYFVKDFLLVAVYVGFLLDHGKRAAKPDGTGGIKVLLAISVLFGCMEVLNPNSPSIFVGLIGLKAYFLYAPIAFILPYVFRSHDQLYSLIRRYLIMAIPVAVLGFIQVVAGPTSPLNTYVGGSETAPDLAAFGAHYEFIRTTGTFSYISGYAAFLSFIALVAIGYITSREWRIKGNVLPITALVLVIGAMFTTGSRAPVYSLVAMIPVIVVLAVKDGLLTLPTALRMSVVLPIVLILALNVSPEAIEAFNYRAANAGDSLERVFGPFVEILYALGHSPFFGYGIGTTHNSALTITSSDFIWWIPPEEFFEGEMPRVMIELGPIGFVLTYFLRAMIVVCALRYALSYRDRAFRALGIALLLYLLSGIPGFVVNDPVAGLYYWGAFGLMLAMRRLDQTTLASYPSGRSLSASRSRNGERTASAIGNPSK